MSAETGLARFDTRSRRSTQNDESSEQTDFRTIGARSRGQLALDEIAGTRNEEKESSRSIEVFTGDRRETARQREHDLEAALGCTRATIDGLREQVENLREERDRLQRKVEDDR